MANAQKLPSGKWRVRIDIPSDGKRVMKSFTGDTPAQAQMKAAQYIANNELQQDPVRRTLGSAIDEFIDNRTNVLSPSTVALYRVLRRSAYESIINVRLSQLTQAHIQRAINEYSRNHAYKTVINAYALLTVVLKEYCPNFKWKVNLPQKSKKAIEIPSEQDVAILLDNSKGTPIYLPILLATQLGLRRGEICALTWDDINLNSKTVRIDESIAQDEFGELVRKKPKTMQSERTLRMTNKIVENLPEVGEKIITIAPKTITKHFSELTKRLGMHYTFHSLRHYYASVMLRLGIPDKYAMERMGHSTNNMLKKVYQHTFESEHEVIDSKLQEYFE